MAAIVDTKICAVETEAADPDLSFRPGGWMMVFLYEPEEAAQALVRWQMQEGDEVLLLRVREGAAGPNGIEVFTADGESLGFISEREASEIAPLIDGGNCDFKIAKVDFIIPLSKKDGVGRCPDLCLDLMTFDALQKPDHPILLAQRPTPPMKKPVRTLHFPIAGSGFGGRAAYYEDLGEGDTLLLLREPDNPFDQNAIAVSDARGHILGYVPKALSALIAEGLDGGSWRFGSVKVKSVVPLSQKSAGSKTPELDIDAELISA